MLPTAVSVNAGHQQRDDQHIVFRGCGPVPHRRDDPLRGPSRLGQPARRLIIIPRNFLHIALGVDAERPTFVKADRVLAPFFFLPHYNFLENSYITQTLSVRQDTL